MNDYKKRFRNTLIVLLIIAVPYFLLGPVEIYSSNVEEFEFNLRDFAGLFFVNSLLFIFSASYILAIFPSKINYVINVLIMAFGLCSYLQNTFMNKQLMNADGTMMNWDEFADYTIINTVIWILIILFVIVIMFVFLKEERGEKVMIFVSSYLVLIQLVAYISLLLTSPDKGGSKDNYIFSAERQFKLATNNNVMVLVLDSYSGQAFEDISEQYPELKETMKDFTFYSNADCTYMYTFPSMIHLLTGTELISNGMSVSQWKKYAWQTEKCQNFYSILHNKGYVCNLYISSEPKYTFGELTNMIGCIDNFVEGNKEIDYSLLERMLLKVTIYRYVPYILKPKFETQTYSFRDIVVCTDDSNGENIIGINDKYYEAIKGKGFSIDSDMTNQFTVTHLDGYHPPLYLGRDGSNIGNESNVEETLLGLDTIVSEYLNKIKEAGVYDNATIFIISDHGIASVPQPIFFVKWANENHDEMQYNNAPISYCDFQATVLEAIGEDYAEFGTSIHDWNPSDSRTRTLTEWLRSSEFPVYEYDGDREVINEIKKNGPTDILIMPDDWD